MKKIIALFALLAAASLFGVDAVWNKPTSQSQLWAIGGNWKDAETGKAASAAPQAPGDTAVFPDPASEGVEQQTVSTGPSGWTGPSAAQNGIDPDIDAVSGTFRHVILHGPSQPAGSIIRRYFSVVNPNDFLGYWTTTNPLATFRLRAKADMTPEMSSLSLARKPAVEVPDAGTAAKLKTAFRGGTLAKEGEGALQVGATTGSDAAFVLTKGDLSFEGRVATAEALLARAAVGATVVNAREVFSAGNWTAAAPYALTSEPAAFGESTLDGEPVGESACRASALTGWHFVSQAFPTGVSVTRTEQEHGETIVFAEPLTRAERQVVNTYLRAKWGARAPVDAGAVFLETTAGSLGVPEGATARVGEAVLLGASGVTKTGDGVLELTRTVPPSAPVTVVAGGIGVTDAAPKGDSSKPADGAWLWLDANRTDTMTFDGSAITAWRDCREGVDVTATYDSTLAPAAPTLTADASYLNGDMQAGTNVVAFTQGQSCLRLPNWQTGAPAAYSVFIAARPTVAAAAWNTPVIGSSSAGDFNRSNKSFISEGASGLAMAGRWTQNGDPVNPLADQVFFTDQWHYRVISFSSSEPFRTDAILRHGTGAAGTSNCGGLYLGEYLVYNRELTPAERRDTEAYLMRKWGDAKNHPGETLPRVASVTFAAENPVVLSSSAMGSVVSATGGNGTLVKTGDGKLYVAQPLAGITSVSVEAGELSAGFGFDDALFHFDASDLESMETEVADAGDGTSVTNVHKWLDVRRNGAFAYYRKSGNPGTYVRNDYVVRPPNLREDETVSGVKRPSVDFGLMSTGDASGMLLDSDYTNVREAIVYGRNVGVSLFSANGSTPDKGYWDYRRGDGNKLFHDSASEAVKTGYINVDGALATKDTLFPWQSYAYYDIGANGDTRINTLAIECYYNAAAKNGAAGGWRLCEEMAFSRNLTDAERAYLCAKLRYKWQGVGTKPVWTNATALASISVAKGATFTETEAAHLSVAELGGGGTLNCGELADVSALALDATSTLTVNGMVRLADAGTISVNCRGAATGVRLPLLKATRIENLDLSKWSVAGTGSRTVTLTAEGDTLFGTLHAPGLILLLK